MLGQHTHSNVTSDIILDHYESWVTEESEDLDQILARFAERGSVDSLLGHWHVDVGLRDIRGQCSSTQCADSTCAIGRTGPPW